MKVFFITPFSTKYRDVYKTLTSAAAETGVEVTRFDKLPDTSLTATALISEMEKSDLVIADVSDSNSNVYFELGIASSTKKPSIIICQQGTAIPADIASNRVIIYDRNRLDETLLPQITSVFSHRTIPEVINKEIVSKEKAKAKLKTVFVSYSHADSEYLTRLEVHLRPFEKAGQIELWSDTRIKAGELWKEQIEHALGKAAIAVLLISADFLASDFIIDNELPPLLKAAEERGTLILPVILKPCRFVKSQSLSKFQAINDPRNPMSKMSENDREEIYVKIADNVDNLL